MMTNWFFCVCGGTKKWLYTLVTAEKNDVYELVIVHHIIYRPPDNSRCVSLREILTKSKAIWPKNREKIKLRTRLLAICMKCCVCIYFWLPRNLSIIQSERGRAEAKAAAVWMGITFSPLLVVCNFWLCRSRMFIDDSFGRSKCKIIKKRESISSLFAQTSSLVSLLDAAISCQYRLSEAINFNRQQTISRE